MENIQVIERIRKDCEEKGHGRKKWWAQNLGIHQQTLSYWLHGQRTPNGYRFEQISNYFSIMNDQKDAQIWGDFLKNQYFNHQKINSEILISIIKKILGAEIVDSRTLGFLSHIVENSDIDYLTDEHPLLRNRLGWLLEISGRQPNFRPVKTRNMPIIRVFGSYQNPRTFKYLKKVQTLIGKRWNVYDADLSQIKRSFIGRLSTDR